MMISDLKENVEKCQLDASLKDLQTDYVDAYHLMAVDNPSLGELNPLRSRMVFIVDFVF